VKTPHTKPSLPSVEQVKEQTREVAQDTKPWVVRLGRLGIAANGLVYGMMGVLAFQVAIGAGGATTDSQGALRFLGDTGGRLLLALIVVGLAGYALWRFVQAALDTEGKGTDTTGLLARGSFVVIGASYAGLALAALRLVLGMGGESGDDSSRDWTAWLLAFPLGQGLVGIVAAVVVGAGLYQFYRAYTADFCAELKLGEMSGDQATWVTRIGRLGHAARGVVFGIVGSFLVVAAWRSDSEQAGGIGNALETLAKQPFGPWLLGIVAVGLLAYGVYLLVEARFRRMTLA
jgi:hypothetical protein